MFSNIKSRSTILRMFATLAALALVYWLLSRQGWEEILAAIGQIQTSRFVWAIALIFLSRFFVTARWHILLRSAGIQSNFSQSARITFAGLFANNFLPSTVGGDVARMGGALQMGFDAAISAASLVVDRAIGLIGMAFAFPIGLQKLLLFRSLGSIPLVAAQLPSKSPLFKRAKRIIERIWVSLKIWVKKPLSLLSSLLLTFLHMLALFMAIDILLRGMGESLPFIQIAGLWTLVYFVTLIPFTINALGLQEVSISYAFSQLGGVDFANSLVLALLIRTLFMLASLPGAFFISDVLPGIAKAKPILAKIDGKQ